MYRCLMHLRIQAQCSEIVFWNRLEMSKSLGGISAVARFEQIPQQGFRLDSEVESV
jgi:hypothetical protein